MITLLATAAKSLHLLASLAGRSRRSQLHVIVWRILVQVLDVLLASERVLGPVLYFDELVLTFARQLEF